MSKGYMKEIKERISSMKKGSLFITADFLDIADSSTIRSALCRLTQNKTIVRVMDGIYQKPEYSKILNDFIEPDPDLVADAIARTYHWTIAPSGNHALNLLGLSTQVPSKWIYVSDGPYKTYQWGLINFEFRHRTNREITGLSYITILVIQALKTLGKKNINEKTIKILSTKINDCDKIKLLGESKGCTGWIRNIIKGVCERRF